ncbi:MAG: hypothetical protein K2F99_04540 [Muribaculaceae bacterium]|nr:hypothetical protein [Muribaculaceae bacterium]
MKAWIWTALVILVAIVAIGSSIALGGLTLIEWYKPVSAGLIGGWIVGMFCWKISRRATGIESRAANYVIASLYAATLLVAAFYTLNFVFDDVDTEHIETVTVQRKYTKTRHRSERVGRNRYRPGRAYKVYFIEVEFDDGRTKDIEIPLSRYNRLRSGGTADLRMSTGLFGVPVIHLREK